MTSKYDFKRVLGDAPKSSKVSSYGLEEWAIEHEAAIRTALSILARVQSSELAVVPVAKLDWITRDGSNSCLRDEATPQANKGACN